MNRYYRPFIKDGYDAFICNFLENAHIKMKIKSIGLLKNPNLDGDDKNFYCQAYKITLNNGNDSFSFVFYDSLYNTEIINMTIEDYVEHRYFRNINDLDNVTKFVAEFDFKKMKQETVPSLTKILGSLNKQDRGNFEDFCLEFGFDEEEKEEGRVVYNAMMNEYKNLKKFFTEEQLKELIRVIG